MVDIYKEQKDKVEIRIKQLKERRNKQCRNQNYRKRYNTNKRTCNK